MSAWRRLGGRLVLVLVMFVSGYLGARFGLLHAPAAQASHNFSDVPDSAFYHDFVDFLVDNGITAGCAPGLFCGEDPVTRGQMSVFLKKLSDLVDQNVNAQVAALSVCPPDSVKVGTACIDTYEASVWEVPPASVALIQKIKAGTVTLAELQAGAVQRGATTDDYGAGCPDTGNGCVNFYAVSVAGVTPSRFITWFQANVAARNAGKRLPTNAEWQAAAHGTPDGAPCIVGSGPGSTGTAGCVSDVGAFDMVGNLLERVADWVPPATSCSTPLFGTDGNCMTIDPQAAFTPSGPGVLARGGYFGFGSSAGVFEVRGDLTPTLANDIIGFRAAR